MRAAAAVAEGDRSIDGASNAAPDFTAAADENGGDKLVHGSGGISQPRAE